MKKKIKALNNEILNKLNNIDNVIDSNLNITITQLEIKSALLNKINYNNLKNGLNKNASINDTQLAIKEKDHLVRVIKSIDCSLKSIIGHVKAITHYINTIDDFRLIKSMLNNDSSKDVDNTTVVYLKGRINDLNLMINNLNSMRLYIDSIINDLNSMTNIMNQQIKINS